MKSVFLYRCLAAATSEQSAQSGLAAYRPGSGLKDATTGITAKYVVKRCWIVALTAGARGLLGCAADSPIVRHAWQASGLVRDRNSF